jgi:hypothetical protein
MTSIRIASHYFGEDIPHLLTHSINGFVVVCDVCCGEGSPSQSCVTSRDSVWEGRRLWWWESCFVNKNNNLVKKKQEEARRRCTMILDEIFLIEKMKKMMW